MYTGRRGRPCFRSPFTSVLLWFLTGLGAPALGQVNWASITGIVTDSAQAVVPGAKITVRNLDTGITRTVESNQEGYYTVPNLDPGRYELVVQVEGFKTYRFPELILQVGQVLRHDVELQIGAVTESVTVTTSVPTIETERGAIVGDVIVHQEIQELPLEGRDFTDLAFLVPGVFPKAQGGQGSAMNIHGARATNTNFYVDGFDNRNPRGAAAQARPNLDAVQEFKMEVSGYSAEYGRYAGGILNVVLRSGTNNFHGSLFEYLRNDIFDARSFFATDREKLRRNQWGATLGGPIVRNKTFFLFSYEGYWQLMGRTRLTRVPTERERLGNFSESVAFLKDPFSKATCDAKNQKGCFPGSIIPASRLHPIGAKLVSYYPLPNRAGQGYNYLASANDDDKRTDLIAKIDHNFSENDKLSWRYNVVIDRMVDPWSGSDLGIFGKKQKDDRALMGLDWTHLFSPTLLIESRAGYSRNRTREKGRFHAGKDIAAELGLPSFVTDPELMDWPRFTVLGHAALGSPNEQPVNHFTTVIQAATKLTWMKSRHTIKAGFDVQRIRFNQPYVNNQRGTYDFQGRWTGHPIADMLLGLLHQTTRTVGINRNYARATNYGAFFNDDLKLTRNLTLNLGLRYELNMPMYDRYGRWANFVPELGKIVIADDRTVPNLQDLIEYAGMQGRVSLARELNYPKSLVYPDYTNFAPRFGLAWRPFGSQRMAVRTGYGIFYSGEIMNPVRNNLANVFPFAIRQTFSRKSNDPTALTLDRPFPEERAKLTGVNNANGFEVRAPSAYLQVWNFTIERELWKQSALTLGYSGSKGTHLGRRYDINRPFRTLEYYLAGFGFPRPYEFFNTINYFSWGSNSIYNALEISLRRRVTRGLFFRVGYLYSKSIDEASQFSDSSDGGYGGAIDPRNLKLERARSDWDRGHVFTAAFNWNLPVGRGQPLLSRLQGWKQMLLGGWQLSGTARAYTGPPFTVKTSDVEWDLGETDRPNRIGRGYVPEDAFPGKKGVDFPWFRLSDFEPVPCVDPSVSVTCLAQSAYGFSPFQIGNSGRNILDGPGLFVLDLGLRKNFNLGEQRSLQIRWDVFNVPNHTNFLLPNNLFNEPSGGYIDRVGESGRQGGPRVMQWALTYRF